MDAITQPVHDHKVEVLEGESNEDPRDYQNDIDASRSQLISCDTSKVPLCVAKFIAGQKKSPHMDIDHDHATVIKQRCMASNNYFRGIKWAPDGSCFMTNSNDHIIRIYNTPEELLGPRLLDETGGGNTSELSAILTIRENSIIYDYIWNTNMDSTDAPTCYLLTTSQNGPIHLWNAYDASLQSTYSVKSQSDELISIHSLAFAGFLSSKILAGYKRNIAIVDVNRPGIHLPPTKKSKRHAECQHGIISCISTNPIDHNMFVAGSYSRQIGIYDLRQATEPQCLLTGQKGGLTNVKFSSDSRLLFSGGRKDQEILCWDMRNLGEVLEVFKTSSYTNQTMYFDVSPDDKFISSGDTQGHIKIWDLSKSLDRATSCDSSSQHDDIQSNKPEEEARSNLVFEAHQDCVNGVRLVFRCRSTISI